MIFSVPFVLSVLKDFKVLIGGAGGIRTPDLLDAIEARSQLRHGPTGMEMIKNCSILATRGQTRNKRCIRRRLELLIISQLI